MASMALSYRTAATVTASNCYLYFVISGFMLAVYKTKDCPRLIRATFGIDFYSCAGIDAVRKAAYCGLVEMHKSSLRVGARFICRQTTDRVARNINADLAATSRPSFRLFPCRRIGRKWRKTRLCGVVACYDHEVCRLHKVCL